MKALFHTTIIFSFLLILFIGNGCKSENHDHDEHDHESPESGSDNHSEKDTHLTLTQKQMDIIGMQIGFPEYRHLEGMIPANGTLELPPQNKAAVSSLLGGLVARIFVIQGDKVSAGQTLAVIENPEIIQIQENYLKAQSDLEYARNELERQEILADEKVVATKKFQFAKTDFENKKSMAASLESQLKLLGISTDAVRKGQLVSGIPVKTPINGYVHRINISTGSYANPAAELFSVVDNHHVHIDLHVFEKDADKVKIGQKVLFGFSEKGEKHYEGEIFAVGKAYDETSRSIGIHAEIRNNKNQLLMPGMFVHARIVTAQTKTEALPDDAIIMMGDLNYVYALTDTIINRDTSYIFTRYAIKTGISDNGFTSYEFIQQPEKSYPMVLKGTYYLKAMEIQNQGSDIGHGH